MYQGAYNEFGYNYLFHNLTIEQFSRIGSAINLIFFDFDLLISCCSEKQTSLKILNELFITQHYTPFGSGFVAFQTKFF